MVVTRVVWIFLLIELSRAQTTLQPWLTFPPLPISTVPSTSVLSSSTTLYLYTTTTVNPNASSSTSIASSNESTTNGLPTPTTTTPVAAPNVTANSTLLTIPSVTSTTLSPIVVTLKPMRDFNILLVFRNLTNQVPKVTEINESLANSLKVSLATKLGVDVASVSNKTDLQLTNGGKPVRITKRSADPPPNNDVTLQFDLKTDIYGTPDEVKNKLKNSSPFQIFDQTASDPLIFVWTDSDKCPSQICSNGTRCTFSYNSTGPSNYQQTCVPVTQASTTPNQGGPNLLYLLLLLLLIPIALLIAVGFYCYRRSPGRNHLVNSYPKEKLQAKFSNLKFGTMKSGKSDIIIMGGEGPPTYETNPKSTLVSGSKVGTVASMHAFENQAFNQHKRDMPNDYDDRNSVVSNHPAVDGDNSMTFSYMQMRNSKVKDDTMALF